MSTLTFLPNRLNQAPVVVLGLTADEFWTTAALCAVLGLILGTGSAWVTGNIAAAPTTIAASVAVGIYAGGAALRRCKRGKPNAWLIRSLQWWIRCRAPSLTPYLGGGDLIVRTGSWTTLRERP